MSIVALITWLLAAGCGLFLLAIWLIEYDRDFQRAAATRLPVPVISAHALLAIAGLIVWAGYLVAQSRRLAVIAALILVVVAILGVTMAVRWIAVYRAVTDARSYAGAHAGAHAGASADGEPQQAEILLPPERNFPLPVVIAHGIFAVATLTLVVLTAIGD